MLIRDPRGIGELLLELGIVDRLHQGKKSGVLHSVLKVGVVVFFRNVLHLPGRGFDPGEVVFPDEALS
jgi:hypothetical protein